MRDQCVLLQKEVEERKTKESLDAALIDEITDQSAKQIADLKAENTRLKVCAVSCSVPWCWLVRPRIPALAPV